MSDLDSNSVDVQRQASGSAKHFVHSLMHFLRIVRYRKGVVITSVVAALMLGALYYLTTTRLYQSRAGILVMQTNHDVHSTRISPEGAKQGLMPTYERILRSSNVLEDAVTRLRPVDRVDLGITSREKWADAIRGNLTVQTVRNSNVIEVVYRSKSPTAAAAVVQAIVDSYLEFMKRTNEGAAADILRVLLEEKDKTYAELVAVRQRVLELRQRVLDLGLEGENGVVHPTVKEAITLNDALIEVRKERAALQATLGAVEAAIRNGEDLKPFILAIEGDVGRQIMMAALGFGADRAALHARLQESLLEDQAMLATLRQGHGDNHPDVQAVMMRLRQTELYLANYQSEVNVRLNRMQNEQLGPMLVQLVRQQLNQALRNEGELVVAYEEAARRASQLVGELGHVKELDLERDRLERMHENMLDKIAGIELTEHHGNIRTAVTDDPTVNESQVWPRLFLVGPFSLIVGLAFGVAAVSVLDVLDDRFRSPDELRLQLAVPLLAMVRKLSMTAESGLQAIQVHIDPDAVESEAFRTLRTAIAFSRAETGRIVISSTEPGDGKTTVLSNLAVAYARAGKRTLMIDADMRRPGLTRLLELRGEDGLTQLLQGTSPVVEMAPQYVRSTGLERLDVLPSGPRQVNPAELLAGPRLAELLAWAETAYDQVLIDAPPAGAAADASIIAAHMDGLVLVVRPDKNRRQNVVRAVEGFRSMAIEPLGIVVNGLSAERDKGYYSYAEGYNYGYGVDAYAEQSEREDQPQRDHRDEVAAASTPDAVPPSLPADARPPIVPRRAA